MHDLIVIGAGPGGYEAAAHAARLGAKVALIEEERIGGTCLNLGCIPARVFLRSSKLFQECRKGACYGVRAASVELDLPAVVARKDRVVATLAKGVEGMLKRAGVEVIRARGRLVSRNAVEAGGGRYEAKNILIATGSRPAPPSVAGAGGVSVLNSDAVFSMTAVPPSVAVIGAGYTGLELACFFNEIGSRVTVFEASPQLAPGTDQEVANRLLQILKRAGIDFQLSCRVTGLASRGLSFTTAEGVDGSMETDSVVDAGGRTPRTGDLGLEEAGVDFGPKGIRVSDRSKTNIPGVWACGDVTGGRMLAHTATRQGIVAVNNMLGTKDRVRRETIPTVIYTHPEVASVGRTEEELKAAGIEYKKSVVPMAVAGRFLVENEGGAGMVKVLTGMRYGEILGVHAVGDVSSEFIVAAGAMVETEMRPAEAREIVFPHPTVSEALREAIFAVQ